MTRTTRAHIFRFVPANESRKTHEGLLLFLFSGHTDLLGVNDHDKVTSIDMRRENRFLFAAQKPGRLHGDVTEHLIFGIDQPPLAVDFITFAENVFIGVWKRARKLPVREVTVNRRNPAENWY